MAAGDAENRTPSRVSRSVSAVCTLALREAGLKGVAGFDHAVFRFTGWKSGGYARHAAGFPDSPFI